MRAARLATLAVFTVTGAVSATWAARIPAVYLGSFTGPPLIGGLAEATGLSAALGLAVVVSVAMAALAGPALGPRRRALSPAGARRAAGCSRPGP